MARLPKWLNATIRRRQPEQQQYRTVTVEVSIDTTEFSAALRRAAAAVNAYDDAMRQLGRTIQRWLYAAETKMYVRGALDPAYLTPAARDEEVSRLLRELPGAIGARFAGAFLRGWEEHRQPVEPPDEPVVWHRYIGTTTLQVRT